MTAAPNQGLWHRNAAFAYGAVFIGVIGHATTEFVQVLSGVAGPELSVWRFALGALGLVLVCLAIPGARDLWTPLKEAFLPIVTLSLFGFAVAYLAFHWALDFASVPQVATTVTTIPIFLALINLWRNKQPIGWLKWVTGIAALIGIALLITDGALTQLAGDGRNLIGVLLALVCALFVGGFMIFAKPYFARYGALRMTTLAIVISALGLWVGVGVLFGRWVDFTAIGAMPSGQVAALLTIGFFNTTITQWFWLGGLAAAPDITRAAYLFFLKPVIAALLALWILQQPVSPMEWLAIVIICGAVAFEALWPRLADRLGWNAASEA
jgi:drug/metabolite transporter (DMT)-like permease